MKLHIFENKKKLFSFSKDIFQTIYQKEIKKKKYFYMALSGGKTPITFFKHLIHLKIDWNKIFFFFVDERCVPFKDKKNNGNLAKKYLFDLLKIKKSHIFYIPTETPQLSAKNYEKTIKKHLKNSIFDLIILGIGQDGHTASLFPKMKALKEKKKEVIAVKKTKEPFQRISFTFPLINKAKNILLLAHGEEKKEAIKKFILEKKSPISQVNPKNLHVLLDEKAAFFLRSKAIWNK